jgi:hypothetical protein
MIRNFKEQVEGLINMGNMLISYTFPRSDLVDEQIVIPLKQIKANIDGYEVNLHYSVADYGNHYLKSVQVWSSFFPFLPFNLICKVGKSFLGFESLSYVDFYKDNKKYYCWTLRCDKNGKLIVPDEEVSRPTSYEGFSYSVLDPRSVNFLG